MSLAGVVILYNPEDSTKLNIDTYIDHVDELYVLDNSDLINNNLVTTLKKNSKVIYIKNPENMGIAYSLNLALEKACFKHTWLITMDQDSFFYKKEIGKYVEILCQFEDNDKVAGIAPLPVTEASYVPNNHTDIESIERCITSGNIIKIKTAIEVGGFDENLFIDQVDHEFCYRCTSKGYKIYQLKNIKLIHHLGNPTTINILGIHKCHSNNHNYIRVYYMVRNTFYLIKKYPHIKKQELRTLRAKIRKIIFIDDNKCKKLRSVYEGYKDYKNNKFGKKYFNY